MTGPFAARRSVLVGAWSFWLAALAVAAVVVGLPASPVGAASAARVRVTRLPSLAAPIRPAPTLGGRPPVSGLLRAPGGQFLYDRFGRVVLLHGVNVVYKHPPYEVYPAPGKPWNFTAADASLMARLGFNVVRLGMTWQGLEPGTAPANTPTICRRGAPTDPHQFNQAVLDRYLGRLAKTVALLGRYHIYTILDMHQDVYNQMFDGEGAPNWAVCTNGVPSVDPPGRWSLEYATKAAGIAFSHFWANNVAGDLQGEFDRVWAAVAAYFKNDPWVVGYDPFNEPFSKTLLTLGDEHFDAQLECFYTGTAHVGGTLHGAPPIHCPPHDPAQGVIPTILGQDPHHLIFYEPDNFASRGFPTFLGSMDFPNLVYNVHIYCGARSPVTGNPTDVAACAKQDARSLAHRARDRPEMASTHQPGGPAWMVTEFGATSNPALVTAFLSRLDQQPVSWAYWSWRFYADPTGSRAESLLMADGRLRSTARVLSRTYPEAIAGTPTVVRFDPRGGAFRLDYVPDHRVHGPTVIFVPTALHYPSGYCARAAGATVTSAPGATLLTLRNLRRSARVQVTVTAGSC